MKTSTVLKIELKFVIRTLYKSIFYYKQGEEHHRPPPCHIHLNGLICPNCEIVVKGSPIHNLDDKGTGPLRIPAHYTIV